MKRGKEALDYLETQVHNLYRQGRSMECMVNVVQWIIDFERPDGDESHTTEEEALAVVEFALIQLNWGDHHERINSKRN